MDTYMERHSNSLVIGIVAALLDIFIGVVYGAISGFLVGE